MMMECVLALPSEECEMTKAEIEKLIAEKLAEAGITPKGGATTQSGGGGTTNPPQPGKPPVTPPNPDQ